MTAIVRPLRPEDRNAWEPLWQGYLAFYRQDLAPEVTETTWARILSPDENPHGFCAVDSDGALVGFVLYLFHRSTWSLTGYCYLEDLFVTADCRGTGTGRALIEAVCAAAEAADYEKVYWFTEENNAVARRLYDRIGRLTHFVRYDKP